MWLDKCSIYKLLMIYLTFKLKKSIREWIVMCRILIRNQVVTIKLRKIIIIKCKNKKRVIIVFNKNNKIISKDKIVIN